MNIKILRRFYCYDKDCPYMKNKGYPNSGALLVSDLTRIKCEHCGKEMTEVADIDE